MRTCITRSDITSRATAGFATDAGARDVASGSGAARVRPEDRERQRNTARAKRQHLVTQIHDEGGTFVRVSRPLFQEPIDMTEIMPVHRRRCLHLKQSKYP